MMRSLWTAASGMIGEQSNLDVIANNLSNINTTGYKTQTANFKSLIYQNLQTKSTTSTGEPKPVEAAYLANLAASVVVAKLGTYAVSNQELQKVLTDVE